MKRTTHLRLQALIAAAVALVAATAMTLDAADSVKLRGTLGPTPGPDSTGHVEGKRAYLTRIAASDPGRSAAALVSFSKFVSAAEAKSFASGMEVKAVFVRFPGSDPDVFRVTNNAVEREVELGAAELGDVVRAEITSIEEQLRTAQGAERDSLNRSLEERGRALIALRPECACVYAIVVQETKLSDLARLQQRSEVELVDVPEPTTDDLTGWELRPILPS
ncbi:MAG TPA: hypothetical protein VFA34_09540 [Actinomycetota bacterium]|jgi:hypothetical protein|nr:hypothetical protein [Actinomycetota bacterium]